MQCTSYEKILKKEINSKQWYRILAYIAPAKSKTIDFQVNDRTKDIGFKLPWMTNSEHPRKKIIK